MSLAETNIWNVIFHYIIISSWDVIVMFYREDDISLKNIAMTKKNWKKKKRNSNFCFFALLSVPKSEPTSWPTSWIPPSKIEWYNSSFVAQKTMSICGDVNNNTMMNTLQKNHYQKQQNINHNNSPPAFTPFILIPSLTTLPSFL